MRITTLRAVDFRNLAAHVSFGPAMNVLAGRNGQGKTNVLEAIHVAATGRSFRTSRTADLLCTGAAACAIELVVDAGGVAVPVSYRLSAAERVLSVAGRENAERRDLADLLRVVFFGPDDLSLVKGSPSQRRDFLDDALADLDPACLDHARSYSRLVRERNLLLRDFAAGRPPPGGLMEAYEEEMAAAGAQVLHARLAFADELAAAARVFVAEQTAGALELAVTYEGTLSLPAPCPDCAAIAAALRDALVRRRSADMGTGWTSVGPHLDDLGLLLNGRPARFFASQGEQRQVAVGLKLAQVAILREQCGSPPVLLLDDVLSELDPDRARILVERLAQWEVQTLITTTVVPDVLLEGTACFFDVDAGSITPQGVSRA